MKNAFKKYYHFVLVVFCFACSKENADPALEKVTYFIINDIPAATGPLMGNISTYERPSEIVVNKAYQLSTPPNESIADIAVSDNILYVARKNTPVLEVIDISGMKLLQTVSLGRPISSSYRRLIISAGKLFISDNSLISNSSSDTQSFLRVFRLDDLSKVDSIPVMKNGTIWAMCTVDNKIFASVGSLSIVVYDANTYTILKSINRPPSGNAAQMLVDGNKNVLAFNTLEMMIIRSSDLTVSKTVSLKSLRLPGSNTADISSRAIDTELNYVYYFSDTPLPQGFGYRLNYYDLNTGTNSYYNPVEIDVATISFDQKNKQIIIGSINRNSSTGGLVKIYSRKADKLGEVSVVNTPIKILIPE